MTRPILKEATENVRLINYANFNREYFLPFSFIVPIKWLAPESIGDNLYTTKSDVWSYGVLLWELSTLGASPYPGIPHENLYPMVCAGYRMEKPDGCSHELYGIMTHCWRFNTEERPNFKELISWFEQLLQNASDYLEPSPVLVNNSTYLQPIQKAELGLEEPLLADTPKESVVPGHRRLHHTVAEQLNKRKKAKRRRSFHQIPNSAGDYELPETVRVVATVSKVKQKPLLRSQVSAV